MVDRRRDVKPLHEAVLSGGSANAPFVVKYMEGAGVLSWKDCTKVKLSGFVSHLEGAGVAQSTAHQYTAVLKAVLNKYKEAGVVPCTDISGALKCKNEKSQKVYLTQDELKALEDVTAITQNERFVQLCFLISAKTGMRVSDTLRVNSRNIDGGMLRYVSKKTKIEACVPVSNKTAAWIREVNAIKARPCTATYENTIKHLCQIAGITSDTKVFKAGKEKTGEKWEFVSSHTARVTFCTLMSQMGVNIQDIATMAGHTSPVMTQNYIVRTAPRVTEAARAFLG